MASSPSRPFASPLQRFPTQSSTSHGGAPTASPSTSFAPAPAEPSAGADPPRLAQLSPADQVVFSVFPLAAAGGSSYDVRWRCFQAVSGTKEEAICALDGVRDLVTRSWAVTSSDDDDDELEEGQEAPPAQHHIFNRSLLAAVVPFATKAFVKQPAQAVAQPQPPQPSPESMGGVPAAAPGEFLSGKEEGGEVWVFHVRSLQSCAQDPISSLFDSLADHLPDGVKELSNGDFNLGDLFPALQPGSSARSTSMTALLPAVHLRKIYPLFLSAARERMLAQLVASSTASAGRERAFRCGDSVILYTGAGEEDGDLGKTGREWGETWTTGVGAEPDRCVLRLTFALDLLPAPHNAFIFVPHIQRIPFLPLGFHPQLRQFSASPPAKPIPVRLLPFDTPAFYLRKSTTSPSELDVAQFWQALAHTGARRPPAGKDDWAVCWVPAPDDVGMKNGSLLSWDTQLILADNSTVELAAETSPRPAPSKPRPPPTTQPGSISSLPSSIAARTTSLADSWRSLTSKTAHHFAPALPSPPDSTEASSPARETVFDEYDDLALATGSYLEGVVKAREQERERLEAEREKERRRKEGGRQTPPTTNPTGSPEGSDDLWGSPPADEPEQISRPGSTTLHLPAVSLPPSTSPEHAKADAAPDPTPPPPPAPLTSVFDPAGEVMDWTWEAPAGSATGSMRAFGVDPLSGLPDEPSWGGPEQVTEDDFDFFDSAPLGGGGDHSHHHHPFTDPPLLPPPPPAPPLINASGPTEALPPDGHASTSYVDPSFSLSPMPNFVPTDGESGEFTLSQLMDVDLTAPSPLDFATFDTQPAIAVGDGIADAEEPTHLAAAAPSPASWINTRTPKTPKMPFSPFVDVVRGDEDFDDDHRAVATKAAEHVLTVGPLALYVPRAFQPIIFGKSHHEADAKYGLGKFGSPAESFEGPQAASEQSRRALLQAGRHQRRRFSADQPARPSFKELYARASTPEEEDTLPYAGLDLRQVYDRAANPRLGVIGRIKRQHKRKRPDQDSGGFSAADQPRRLAPRDAAFFRSPPPEGADQSDEDDDDVASVARLDGPHSVAGGPEMDLHSQSRKDEADPPVGKLLVSHLRTGVFPSELVPLPSTLSRSAYAYGPPPSISTPMPLSALTPGPMAASTPAWAPTPTSPPFMPPPMKEYSKEALMAFTGWLLDEVVGNPILCADVLRAEEDRIEQSRLFPSDLATATAAFKLQSAALSAFLDPSVARVDRTSLVRAAPRTKVAVGFQSKILKVAVEAIPFWSKIRLEPVGGQKDVAAFAVYESTGAGMNATVARWLAALGKVYEARGLGRHVPGSMAGIQNGLVAVDPHQLAELLRPLLSQLGSISHAVIYILTPPNVFSPTFDLREVQQQLSDLFGPREAHVLVHLVPYADVLDPATGSDPNKRLAHAVYDRLVRKVERLVPRRIFDGDISATLVSYPAFHLARSDPPALQFQLKWPPPPLNLLDHHAFLHIAYGTSDDGEWLFGCVIDERAQEQLPFTLRLETAGASATLDAVVNEVYGRATAFAKRADAEWRVVVARLGLTSVDEVKAWDRLLSKKPPDESQALQIFVTASAQRTLNPLLLFGTSSASRTASSMPSPAAAPISSMGAMPLAVDATSTGSILYPRYRLPLALDSKFRRKSPAAARKDAAPPLCILPLATFTLVSSPGTVATGSAGGSLPSHLCSHLLLVGATPAAAAPPTTDFGPFTRDLADSYHALSLLTRHRWHTASDDPVGRLPLHLAAVARMAKAYGALKDLLP